MTSRPKTTTDVLIVGGGVSGLTASLLLSQAGVEHVLVERHDRTALLPKAHIINQRSMEIYRGLGVADEIYALGAPAANMSHIAWMTSLTGPTALHGKVIGRVDAWSGGDEYAARSSCRATNLPQLRLEPVLRRRAESSDRAKILFDHELTAFDQTSDGAHATVLDRQRDQNIEVEARYVIAADGGRFLGPASGILMEGERDLLDMVSTHFSADLSSYWSDESVVISFSTNPDGEGSLGSGVLLPMGPDAWGAKSPEWQYHSALHSGDPDQFDDELMIQRMREMLGLPDFQPLIHSISRWSFEGVLADRYSSGRVFFVGDSAHRHPPNGGLGLNTAVGDVHNLVWKLALVLRGGAGPELLDTYEQERHPVGAAVVDRALSNWRAHIGIDQALGVSSAENSQGGWAALEELFSDTEGGIKRRQDVDQAIAAASREFVGQDVELGYRYGGRAVLGEATDSGHDTTAVFDSTIRTGACVSHAWLQDRDTGTDVSTLDLAGGSHFTLFVGPDAVPQWTDAAAHATRELALDARALQVHSIGPAGSAARWIDASGAWNQAGGPTGSDAVLTRPDRHVAWLGRGVTDPAGQLMHALSAILSRDI
ncbi:FAD-dependent monooxygenase [Streptomyces sp. NPDC096311]|uniref:FAD-dependent monooxygenase n=1 Tax=Streptomyces sp. NPDC096311 TaxID=3366083 RepID=UPI00382CC5A3